jgi:hypothetical protein
MANDYRIELLDRLIYRGENYYDKQNFEVFKTDFISWHHQAIYQLELFDNSFSDLVKQMKNNNQLDYDINYIRNIIGALKGAREILIYRLQTANGQNVTENTVKPQKANELMNILDKFSDVANQLLDRYNKRPTIEMNDEYDVQDLLHALLRIHFDDIRPEVWTPPYAGGSSRMDFLLKDEQIVIEVKKTRDGLGDNKVGEQLIVDEVKYSEYQDCKTLICFVYDPEKKIKNPMGLVKDFEKMSTESFSVIVKVVR